MYLPIRICLKIKAFSLCMLLLLVTTMEGYGQTKVLANQVTFTSGNKPLSTASTVQDPNNAIADNNSYARLLASPGLAVGLGSYQGIIELKFAANRNANSWSYIRINSDNTLLGALLGGSLGDLLGDLLGTILLGRQGIEIQARNSAGTTVLTRTSSQGFSTDRVRLVRDRDGSFYLAIKPDQIYDRIRLINRSISALGLGSEYTLDVYSAFFFLGENDCALPTFTSFDGTGLTLDLLKLGGTGVTNPHYAIDEDANTASGIGLGVLGVAASMSQYIYLSKPSTIGDGFNVTLQINNSALLNLGLGDGIVIRAWSGNSTTPVFEQAFNESNLLGLISLDLLNLLKSGEPVTVPFSPTVSFDRIEIAVNTTINASIPRIVNVYDMSIVTAKPIAVPNTVYICSGETAQLSVTTQSPKLRWYLTSDAIDYEIETDSAESYNVSPTAHTTFWVSAVNACSESERVPIEVIVHPKPLPPHVDISN